ncbi:vanadium-dependent haloperoxidase [Thalassovita sp.]|uniref:vanadium-dependent haloperoxidase n=1 Tax=Thalassovita sp. TaxID=1979401 RepID=UPI0029DE5424|nr:vanadium-dependent haloperoxidase [Thalassovita sp.]
MRWSDHLVQAVRDTATPPPPATRAFAIGHLAGFVAVNGISPRYQTPVKLPEAPAQIDPEVAYGTALATTIAALFSTDDCALKSFLAGFENGEAKTNGVAWGVKAAEEVLAWRAGDGVAASKTMPYDKLDGPMAWQPTGPFFGAENGPTFKQFSSPLLPGWGKIQTFGVGSARDFRPTPFPRQDSREFLRQLEKVFHWGGATSDYRTADQTEIAFFWEDGPRGSTPPGHWQIIALDLLQRQELDLVDQARFMALISMAQADSAIVTWDCKYDMDVLRPETAIRTKVLSQEKFAQFHDPEWKTLIPTPPFPAYTSGHSTFSGASSRMLAHLLGTDNVSFAGTAPDLVNWPLQLKGVRRSWTRLSQAADEAGASREYGGIHWESDNTEGLRIGRLIADTIFDTALPRLG